MSRTIRNMLRYHNAPSVKWYKPSRWVIDAAALKAGKPKVTTFQKTLREKYLYKSYEEVEYRSHYVDEYGKRVIYTATDYIDKWVEHTRKIPNPEFNDEEYDAFRTWKTVHHYVYRNGTCRRQRKNAVKHAKRAASRFRRSEDRAAIKRELKAFYEEVYDVSSE